MDTSANLTLVWPWALALAGLPWLLHRWLRAGAGAAPDVTPKTGQSALKLPLANLPVSAAEAVTGGVRRRLDWRLLIWLLLVLALARPEWRHAELEINRHSRQLMLVVDISGSMNELMQGRTRLDQVRQVVRSFVNGRPDDRMGLVVFGGQSYLYVPKTLDHALLLQQLQGLQPGMAGPGTAIGDAVGLAVRSLRQTEGEAAILLLTDGANNAGQLSPVQALAMAEASGIRTHLIVVDLNPEPDMASAIRQTGGEVFSAFSRRELEQVYAQINHLEPQTRVERFNPSQSLAHWPLLLALLIALLLVWSGKGNSAKKSGWSHPSLSGLKRRSRS
ncbi:VWA domain-containing protein [Marinospirillum alkaliphilum]|uniref:Ca-activated chloride channel family protein n=1 Tax=Marinospirillum alkaliphilum DSM 21637 TaxID=1122209 RepID=A0A1K1YHD4_9GAMM|nr:VWA domain-containing protein [Marinospirillum alkaliphilum]SFX60781.1 Ca-activated chloride channel family protein [Marinospirillum alkaliphilum DSM 21637]